MSKCVFPETVTILFTPFPYYDAFLFSFQVILSKLSTFPQRFPKWKCLPKLGINSSNFSVRLSSGDFPGSRGGFWHLVSSKHH